MRIAHAIQMPLLHEGGVEVLVRTLIANAPESTESFLVSKDPPEELGKDRIGRFLKGHYSVPDVHLTRSWSLGLLDWVRGNRIELVHFHLSGSFGWRTRSPRICPVTVLGKAGVPVVTTNHQGFSYFDPHGPYRPGWRRILAFLREWPGKAIQLGVTSREICVSRNDFELTRREFPFSAGKLEQIYHSRLDERLDAVRGGQLPIVLNVGTIAFRKGQHLLAEAFSMIASEFPEWSLRFVGTPAEAACVALIRDHARRAGIEARVHMEGADPDPSKFFLTSGIYVQPSLIEGLGLSLQEAMFHGGACIGSDTGGISELICNPAVGLLYPPGNALALAGALRLLMADPERREQMGTAARSSIRARGMTRQAMSASYQSIYRSTRDSFPCPL